MSTEKVNWNRTGDAQWTSNTERAYSAVVDFTAPGTYTLTITGSGAPAAADYATLRLAKNAFRKFLTTK